MTYAHASHLFAPRRALAARRADRPMPATGVVRALLTRAVAAVAVTFAVGLVVAIAVAPPYGVTSTEVAVAQIGLPVAAGLFTFCTWTLIASALGHATPLRRVLLAWLWRRDEPEAVCRTLVREAPAEQRLIDRVVLAAPDAITAVPGPTADRARRTSTDDDNDPDTRTGTDQ